LAFITHIWLGDLRGLISLQLDQMHLGCWVDNAALLSLTCSPNTQNQFASSAQSVNARIGLEIVTLQCLQCNFVELTDKVLWNEDLSLYNVCNATLWNWQVTLKWRLSLCNVCNATLWNWQGTLEWRLSLCNVCNAHCRTDKVLFCWMFDKKELEWWYILMGASIF
jgi:hypothetical protein